MAITYKTVIAQAINNFNGIQDALSALGAKYNNAAITLTTSTDPILVPTAQLSNIISGQLQLKATGNITITAQSGTDVSTYATASVRSAAGYSVKLNATDSTVSVGSLTSGYYTLSNTMNTATIGATTAGWFSSNSATNVLNASGGTSVQVGKIAAATFDISGAVVYCKTAGYVPAGDASTGLGTIAGGSVSSSATITATTLTPGTNGITVSTTKPSSGTAESDYFTLKPYATASSSMSLTPGYITSKGTEGTASSTNKTTYYVNKSTATSNAEDFSFTPTLSNGGASDSSTDDTASGNVDLYATSPITTSKPSAGYYLKLRTNSTTDTLTNTVSTTEGYTKGETYNADSSVTVNASETYVRLKEGAVNVTSGKTHTIPATSLTASVEGSNLTVSGSTTSAVNLTRTEGYISAGAANSSNKITVSASKTVDLTALDSNLSAGNIKAGVTIFGITGTLTADNLLPDFDEDALAAHILAGYKAYDEKGTLITGSLADFSVAASSTNAAGATGAGLNIGASTTTGYLPTLDGTTLKVFMGSTGYVKKDVTYVTATVPTQTKTVTSSNTAQTVTPDSGKLLSSVTVNAMADAVFSGNTLDVTTTEDTNTISGATNIAGSVTLNPSTVSGYVAKIKLSGTASPSVTSAGYVEAGTPANAVVTVNENLLVQIAAASVSDTYLTTSNTGFAAVTSDGYIQKTKYIKAGTLGNVSGTVTIKNNSTSPTKSGDSAVINDSASTYVLVSASGTAKGNIVSTPGWIVANSAGSEVTTGISDTARIPASVSPTLTANSTNAASTVSVGTATQFNEETGAISSVGQKSNTNTISGTVSGSGASLKDKYIVGGASVSGSVSGTATANIGTEATGSNVDSYVESLYKRMLGQSYTAVDAD